MPDNKLPVSEPQVDYSIKTPAKIQAVDEFGQPIEIDSNSKNTFDEIWNNLTGWDGRERYQTWPEKMIRSAVTLPSDVYSGKEPIYDENGNISQKVIERAQDTSGLMGGGSFINPAEGAIAGTFAGKRALTANQAKLDRAVDMTFQGRTPNEIWEKTGWHMQAPDQLPRWEIDDSKAAFIPNAVNKLNNSLAGEEFPLSKILDHPELYKAYPELKNLPVFLDGSNSLGSFYGNKIGLSSKALNDPKILLHEIQHGIQRLEGFDKGGSPEQSFEDHFTNLKYKAYQAIEKAKENPTSENYTAAEQARDAVLDADKRRKDIGLQIYKRLAGETEARNVEKRQPMDALDRQIIAPWHTQDVPTDKQIPFIPVQNTGNVKFSSGLPFSFTPVDGNPFEEIK